LADSPQIVLIASSSGHNTPFRHELLIVFFNQSGFFLLDPFFKVFDSANGSCSALTAGEKAERNIAAGVTLSMWTKITYCANAGPGLFEMIQLLLVLPRSDEASRTILKSRERSTIQIMLSVKSAWSSGKALQNESS
jgi:hypothetical protein